MLMVSFLVNGTRRAEQFSGINPWVLSCFLRDMANIPMLLPSNVDFSSGNSQEQFFSHSPKIDFFISFNSFWGYFCSNFPRSFFFALNSAMCLYLVGRVNIFRRWNIEFLRLTLQYLDHHWKFILILLETHVVVFRARSQMINGFTNIYYNLIYILLSLEHPHWSSFSAFLLCEYVAKCEKTRRNFHAAAIAYFLTQFPGNFHLPHETKLNMQNISHTVNIANVIWW